MSELALVESAPALDVEYWGGVLVFAAQVADAVSDTEFVATALRGRREAVAATIIYGAEVGLTPMQALNGIHVVDGRPAPSAELCRAMILRAGHTLHVAEMTGTRARVWGQRKGRPDSERVVVEWTSDMARSAGLLGRQAWQRYPRAMLIARATGDLARILFPDVVKGLGYVAEDDGADLEAWGPEPESPVARRKAPLQRRKRTPATTPVVEAPAPALEPVTEDSPTAPDRWLTDEEAVARAAEEARAAVEESITARPRVSEDDEPLPDEMQPVGTGRPLHSVMPEPPDGDGGAPNAPAPVLIGERPLMALNAGLTKELGTAATREERHALVGAILGHPIESTKTLPRAEGYRVLDYLDRFADGSAGWEFVEGGTDVRVFDTREPPPDE